jgi:hypothetical protein
MLTIVILETRKPNGSEFRVKVLNNFIPFDWDQPNWEEQLRSYEHWLSSCFIEEEPFKDFETAIHYAQYLSLECKEEDNVEPEIEIIII